MSFLTLLRDDVRSGLDRTPQEYRDKHAAWIKAQQQPDGGFGNRRSKSDLYYTAFALRSLSALNALTPEIARSAVCFLKALMTQPEALRTRQPSGCFSDAVMAASWWDCLGLCEEVAGPQLEQNESQSARNTTRARLSALRRSDGGYGKTDVDGCGSLYHTFLAACAYLRMGEELPEPSRALDFVRSITLPEGGFLENKYSKRPGTNGCAAGVVLSSVLGDADNLERHARFVAGMHSAEGGFYATPAAPIADLLSTYTALFTLKILERSQQRLTSRALAYARTLEADSGGYTGFALETIVDCEYTFYGLGVESLA
ncbi:MAG TPA: prenyltransferase/squalene oxidase repeat-containing protein [Planctomycetota bacterium]|nr:prenyltransferase/squalene oxidase repeat-containing protein [Planctomycetota bacterium]